MKLVDALLATAGSLVVIGGLGWLLARLEPGPAHLRPGPTPDPPTPGPPGPPAPPEPHGAPKHLTTDPVPVSPGRRYLASIVVSAPLSWLATASKARRQAEIMGFQDVIVTTGGIPSSWPSEARSGPKADYYVEATYAGAPITVSRSQAGGQVHLIDAWEV